MATAPTNKPTPKNEATKDPWRTPTPRPAGVAKKQTAQQKARLKRAQQANARIASRITWPMAYRWTMSGAICRILAACVLIGSSFEYVRLHSLAVSPTTTQDQWNTALHTAQILNVFSWLVLLAIVIPSQAWIRTRAYVAKLPGAAPHPLQSSNTIYRIQHIPAYWPPVPEGTPSWTRRVHWRVPPTINWAVGLLLIGTGLAERWLVTGPDRYTFFSVTEILAAALAFAGAFLDIVRLRAYSRWPGRS
jgi:hypothetical protein